MPKTIDMLRSVPECAVRLWAGGTAEVGPQAVQIRFEGKVTSWPPETYRAAVDVAKILAIRGPNRMLRTIQDVLDLRHEAEDIFTEGIFKKSGVPKVLFVPAGVTASGYYRAMIPSDLMFEDGRTIAHFTMSVDLAKVLRYDVLWIQLITSPILHEIARQAKAEGVRIVYDIDDRLDSIPEENQARNVYGDPDKQREIQAMIDLADCVTVSTEPLAEYVRTARGHGNVRVLPNMLTANVMPRRHRPDPSITRILWAGSPTHKRDLAIIAPALCKILVKHAGRVRFTCFGERMPEALAAAYQYIDMKAPVDFEEYHDALAGLAANFGIAPLEDNTFNKSKSAIKALEYAAAGYPMLLSPVGEYPKVVADGLQARLVKDDEWEAAIEQMVAMDDVSNQRLSNDVVEWVMKNRCMGRTKARPWSEIAKDVAGMVRALPEPVAAEK